MLKIISELKTTLSEIKKDNEVAYKSEGGYIICVVLLELIKTYVENPNDYGLDFDIEEKYPL